VTWITVAAAAPLYARTMTAVRAVGLGETGRAGSYLGRRR
jgi:hypothetical protein